MVEKTPWKPERHGRLRGASRRRPVLRAEAASTGRLAAGNLWHEPLPLELGHDREPLVRLLRAALDGARSIAYSPSDRGGVAGRVLLAPRHALVVVVNERPEAASRRVLVDGHAIEIRVGSKGFHARDRRACDRKNSFSSETRT